MRRLWLPAPALGLALLAAGCAARPAASGRAGPLAGARQLVLVTAATWDAPAGRLRAFERAPGGAWRPVGAERPVALGRAGLGWGRGLHGLAAAGPHKQEGDGRSPAGAFALGAVFGAAPAAAARFVRLPYRPLTPEVECVDDPASRRYNEILDRRASLVDWRSSERLVDYLPVYRWGVVVDHNAALRLHGARPAAGAGSCIFLHLWHTPTEQTDGCTAMAEADLVALLRWLDPAAQPVLVQLPAAEAQRLRASWDLP